MLIEHDGCKDCRYEVRTEFEEPCLHCCMNHAREERDLYPDMYTPSIPSQQAKADAGKLQLTLVPLEAIEDIAEIRMYGNQKYHDPDNWKTVEIERYRDALFRHFLAYLKNPHGVDEESGLEHYKHMICNCAFICALERNG